MARNRRERKVRWITPEQAKARQSLNFDDRPERKERSALSLLVSLILVSALLGAIIIYILYEPGNSGNSSNSNPQLSPAAPVEFETDFKTPPVDWTGKLPLEIVNDFCNAQTVDDYLEHLDHLPDIEKEAREFFGTGPGSREKVSTYTRLPPLHTLDGRPYIRLRLIMESGMKRLLFIRWDPSGPKIDFHSYARINSHSLDDLISGKAREAAEMRLEIRPDNFYLGEFEDDLVWQSFRGILPDSEEHISLYVRRKHMSEFLRKLVKTNQSVSATLALRALGNSNERKQFEITKVHQFNWLTIIDSKTK